MDLHFAGLEALGARFEFTHGLINASVGAEGLRGAEVALEFPSVGATENLMIAATRARGTTHINNAAREPEIVDLADFLTKMGARITGAGSPLISIEGTEHLVPAAEHHTVGDRIEAGTFLVAGALTQGPLTVAGVNPAHLGVPLAKLREFGCEVSCEGDRISIARPGELRATDIQTLPYPGFPTDLQAQFMVLDAIARGVSVITENVFENRFMFADELNRMGANVRIEGHHALVYGVSQLSGAPVQAPDLRAGAALLLAGLIADGQTTIAGVEHINRGYEDIVGRLAGIGADIVYESAAK
jgi:UDP-N-acetylglucosamine 1-carboxyvinyltransferase